MITGRFMAPEKMKKEKKRGGGVAEHIGVAVTRAFRIDTF